jgi:hypothetical protein
MIPKQADDCLPMNIDVAKGIATMFQKLRDDKECIIVIDGKERIGMSSAAVNMEDIFTIN